VNATLCAVWFFSASFGGTVLNLIGPAVTACLGVLGYIVYVGSLWYFDHYGKQGFPIFAGICIGISSGLIFVTMGYIAMSYSEEKNRGSYITMSINLQALGSVVGGIIPLIINRKSTESAGVPAPVYIVFMVMMGCGAVGAFLLMPPNKIKRDDGTMVGLVKPRTFVEELKANLEIFRDWKLSRFLSTTELKKSMLIDPQ
jgi:MFS family permease